MFSVISGSVNTKKYHTPITYRSQRRLVFSPTSTSTPSAVASPGSDSTQPPLPVQPAPPSLPDENSLRIDDSDGNVYTLKSFIKEYGGSLSSPPVEWLNAKEFNVTIHSTMSPTQSQRTSSPERVLPWENDASKITSLYKSAPPKLVYPAGSRDEDVNKRFLTRMDHYLFRSFHSRQVLVGSRPHPFSNYPRLNQYWATLGFPQWKFSTSTTFATLEAIKENKHMNFYNELYEVLWWGGCVSYGSIMSETYAIMYAWITDQDLPDLEGLCEENDGPTFRKVIIDSLRVVRVQHTQEQVARLYKKLDSTALVLRPGGMAAYFAKINQIRLQLKKKNEIVSDSYLLHRTYLAVEDKHSKLDGAVAEMRRVAGASGIPTSFSKAKDNLIDTFEFELPISAKQEKVKPTIPAKYAGDASKKRGRGKQNQHNKGDSQKPKRVFEKGSCKHCPHATDHTTKYCFKEKRIRKGLPPGWQWCTVHKNALHYDHACFRHEPNYPSPPKIKITRRDDTNALHSRVLKMLGMSASTADTTVPQPDRKVNITLPDDGAQPTMTPTPTPPPRTAPRIPTNSAEHGPPVNQVLDKIMEMSKPDRMLLASRLSKAGF